MKTKQRAVIGLLTALIAISIAFTACKDDDPVCECPNGTVHTDAECSCEAVGYDCNCTHETPKYTGVTLGGTIQIWAEVGVNFELAKSLAEGIISDTFDGFGVGPAQDDFVGKVDIIYIDNAAAGKGLSSLGYIYQLENEKQVLRIDPSTTYISNILLAILSEAIKLSYLPTSTTIRLAQNTTRNTVGV